jgi:hypothetical protein
MEIPIFWVKGCIRTLSPKIWETITVILKDPQKGWVLGIIVKIPPQKIPKRRKHGCLPIEFNNQYLEWRNLQRRQIDANIAITT